MSDLTKVGSGLDSAKSRKRRPRFANVNEKKIADDEFMAAAIGDVEWLKQSLREAKGQINFDKNGLSALHLAAIHGRLECLKLLVEKYKYNINLPSTTGWRAVHLSISNQTGKRALECLKYLVDKKANPSVVNNDGITPVHQAASEGHVQCLKLLIEVEAQIDGKDCRGHTPLDLAKLWGHKKCARILAAELWHQDKDGVAKEMGQLKQLKMQQVLKELEEAEDLQKAQEFYGEKSYQDWLKKKNLPDPRTKEEMEQTKGKREPLQKPNSKAPPQDQMYSRDKDSDSKIHVSFENASTPTPGSKYVRGFSFRSSEEASKSEEKENLEKKPRARTAIEHPYDWRLALHPPKPGYITNLTDEYPRDMYTMMPKNKSATMYYDGKFAPKVNVIDENSKHRKLKSMKIQKPNLPDEVIDRYLSNDPTRQDRPMVFKSRHISDVNKKKKYEDNVKGKDEVTLHLCEDFSSFMYRNALLRSNTIDVIGKQESDDWQSKAYPTKDVLNTLKILRRPTHFPNIKGEEYVLGIY
ncbi:ankyrin repeat domain-containing protein 53-like [Mytilus trossulus]|uniref:ankyrin repeat domain-containing protein 53-like n=1 Tax=Mytilus trossulus TaxID=6551 RepID=UPI003007A6DC